MSLPSKPTDPPLRPLSGYELVVCVTGGIAAYKSATLVSRCVQAGAGVTVCMTRSAKKLISEVTFRALTGRPVHSDLWRRANDTDMQHLSLSERADLLVVAPATANIIGKLASGIADDLISTLLLGVDCPVVMAPAMNNRMWAHPAVQRNVAFLREMGVELIGPDDGWLACRHVGPGRMSEPEAIFERLSERLKRSPPRGTHP